MQEQLYWERMKVLSKKSEKFQAIIEAIEKTLRYAKMMVV